MTLDVSSKLDQWVQAKRIRDFETADQLRDELRMLGVDAENERPAPRRASNEKMLQLRIEKLERELEHVRADAAQTKKRKRISHQHTLHTSPNFSEDSSYDDSDEKIPLKCRKPMPVQLASI